MQKAPATGRTRGPLYVAGAAARLHHAEGQHRVGDLLEARDIRALHVVDIAAALIAIAAYVVALLAHPWIAGVPALP